MRSMITVIALSVASLVGVPALAQKDRAHRVVAESVDLSSKDGKNLQLQIWADRVPTLLAARQELQKSVPSLKPISEFFTTSFNDGKSQIILSAVNDQCTSTQTAPNDLFCPARFVELTSGKLRLLKQIDDFDVHMVRGEAGFDASSNRSSTDMTMATFDPATKVVTVTVVDDGKSQDPVTYMLN